MDLVDTQALILAALAPLHEAVAKLSQKQNILGTRLAISELLAIAVINSHPNPSELEAAFFDVVLEAEVAQSHVPHGDSTGWENAVQKIAVWLKQSHAQAA